MKPAKLFLFCLPLFSLIFNACAVMTVDVDVYKGPLANHEDVQIQQMASMASGAKKLLVELRNRLEFPKGNDWDDYKKSPFIHTND